MARPEREEGTEVVTRPKTAEKVARPQLFKVLLHNDDYTTREFVVWALERIFHRSEPEAMQIMLHVHHNGIGVAGIYPFDIADAKMRQVSSLAEENEFPLLTTLEPE